MIGRWLSKILIALSDRLTPKYPYAKYFNLKLGQVNDYGRIVPKDQVPEWLAKGWVEVPGFSTFGFRPKVDEVFVFGTPKTLMDIEPSTLIGMKIAGYGGGGWYGMGSPGYFGLVLHDSDTDGKDGIALLYTVWFASSYMLVDDRIVACSPQLYDRFHPWLAPQYVEEHIPHWDDLSEILCESEMTALDLADDQLTVRFEKNGKQHIIEFVKNDPRLAPYWNGIPLRDAFDTGVIRERFIFQEPGAILFEG
ncbi:MAG: hypothetical protein U0670_14260 [Anaerolineae bacterium]